MKQKPNVIRIEITGPVQSGKSAVMASIREYLKTQGYGVALPERSERLNPSRTIEKSHFHELPRLDHTVFVLTEVVSHETVK